MRGKVSLLTCPWVLSILFELLKNIPIIPCLLGVIIIIRDIGRGIRRLGLYLVNGHDVNEKCRYVLDEGRLVTWTYRDLASLVCLIYKDECLCGFVFSVRIIYAYLRTDVRGNVLVLSIVLGDSCALTLGRGKCATNYARISTGLVRVIASVTYNAILIVDRTLGSGYCATKTVALVCGDFVTILVNVTYHLLSGTIGIIIKGVVDLDLKGRVAGLDIVDEIYTTFLGYCYSFSTSSNRGLDLYAIYNFLLALGVVPLEVS